ncbi:molybdenum ABC transporter ATP-binding protein ModC [Morganella psychrotolerans]|uniref:Molybdenum ABC transporter ATP-binding protein ModC n=1 Tax=Morganella psychrotolerans TaxID=368603 RepID=A0A5M9R691_9GAMM|nr:molybdenum ABC transporter ATP-binding protein ModC [Morganella psychrotolerans]KAA8716444.1 molybdenum ABC transporter ATP-binding protein ModC [Morganella psychrotolerans]OBU09161.1 molybdenum ABC transporter ATP-binding protein [Morganella psychrotolerans]
MLILDFEQQLGDLSMVINTQLASDRITAIFGLSGAGKTSFINVIGGLTRPQKGRIELNGHTLVDIEKRICLPPEKRKIGYVFQDARLFPHYRIKGNLRYGMAPEMADQFDSIVALLGIGHLLNRLPMTLSGGEKQRVAIGRALLTAPDILLMDEPLASLDLPRKRELLPFLEKLAQDIRIPILYVSHSLDEILRLAEDVVILDKGRILAQGPLEEVWAGPALRPWLREESLSSVINVTILKHHDRYAMTATAISDQVLWVPHIDGGQDTAVRVRISADDVSVALEKPKSSSIRNILRAKITEMYEDDNGQTDVRLAVGNHFIWARITGWAKDDLQLKPGQWVFAQIKSVSLSRRL